MLVDIEKRIRSASSRAEAEAWELALNLRGGVEDGYRPVLARKPCGYEELVLVEDRGDSYTAAVQEAEALLEKETEVF